MRIVLLLLTTVTVITLRIQVQRKRRRMVVQYKRENPLMKASSPPAPNSGVFILNPNPL